MASELPRDSDADALLRKSLPATLTTPSPECLDAETLAAWADRSLEPQQASRVESHLSTCARCQEMAAAFATADDGEIGATSKVVPIDARRPWRWIVPVGLAAAAALVWAIVPRHESSTVNVQMARAEQTPVIPPAPPPKMNEAAGQPVEAPAARPPQTSEPQRQSMAKSAAPADSARARDAAAADTPSLEPSAAASRTAQADASQAVESAPAVATVVPAVPPSSPAAPPPPPARATLAAPLSERTAPRNASVQDGVGGTQIRASGFSSMPLLELTSRQSPANAAGRSGNVREVAAPTETRWRVSNYTVVQRSFTGGRSWDVIPVDPPSQILAGSASSPMVCWFVGTRGLVLLTTNATTFVRVRFPETVDLTQIAAASATEAVATTRDGRVFQTADGGTTWTLAR